MTHSRGHRQIRHARHVCFRLPTRSRVFERSGRSTFAQEILSEVLTRALDRSIAREAGFSLLPVNSETQLSERH